VLATIDPTRAADADADAQVVFSGEADLNADQVRMLISTALAERIADGEPAVDNDFSPPSGSGLGTAVSNLIAAPMTHDGNRLGVLLAINREGDDFDSVDLKLVGALASQGAVFLANSRLYAELQDLLMGVLHALSSAIDAKDPYTSGHSQRVARLSRRLAEAAGLGAEKARHVYLCGLLHDIGKIGVPESVLCKAGKLTDEEYTVIKRHPSVGAKILQGIRHLEGVIEAILTHHERPDGRGYPRGLVGEQIPLEGRIVGLADVFDAMTSDRTYRKALPLEVVAEEIRSCAGTQFDTGLAELLLSMDLDALREELYLDGPEDLLGNARRHKELTRWT
jgi:putative nucleotidyltransferase with HDIG domain